MRTVTALVCVLIIMGIAASVQAEGLTLEKLTASPAKVSLADGQAAPDCVEVVRKWEGNICKTRVVNNGKDNLQIKEVALFDIAHDYPAETRFYGEGFTMLSQTGGTLQAPKAIGCLTDADHYKIPHPKDATTVYNLLMLSPDAGERVLLAFSSSRRFSGAFNIRPGRIEVVMDTESLVLEPGQEWQLEDFMFVAGPDRNVLLNGLAQKLNENHPRLAFDKPPTGWCSWYCFGPAVTAPLILKNLDYIKTNLPAMRYVQIDDGYQAAMGDWLAIGKAFGGDIKGVIRKIKDNGFEPGIWVAPFIAEAKSEIFQQHPDWFIKDDQGQPLASDKVTFGGWRNGPWYGLDGTHPEVQKHFENVFRTLREEWGCTYFKLDANYWGAMHGGHFYDPKATRVEAYRRGMEAVLRGTKDSFVLGCNHPLWPSLGLIHGSRSSMDIDRSWNAFRGIAFENLNRNWQNGKLWWNDPDCILLTGKPSNDEFVTHATAIYATGGMLLAGDNLPRLKDDRLDMLRKTIPPTGVPAEFTDDSFTDGRIVLSDRIVYTLFNWDDSPKDVSVTLPGKGRLKDVWTDKDMGKHEGRFNCKQMPPHSARLLEFRQK